MLRMRCPDFMLNPIPLICDWLNTGDPTNHSFT